MKIPRENHQGYHQKFLQGFFENLSNNFCKVYRKKIFAGFLGQILVRIPTKIVLNILSKCTPIHDFFDFHKSSCCYSFINFFRLFKKHFSRNVVKFFPGVFLQDFSKNYFENFSRNSSRSFSRGKCNSRKMFYKVFKRFFFLKIQIFLQIFFSDIIV